MAFPSCFKFGAASAAYQIEGAWNVSGGWANPASSDWFADYVRVVFRLFGDRVKTWLTINEPVMECDYYYGNGILNPPIDYFVGPYMCNKNILLAHAKAYRVYDKEFRQLYGNVGKVSIANHLMWVMPASEESKFGLYQVDFNDPLRPRTARKSVQYYANLIKNRVL
ncbi:hypothetical protein HF086_008466 [Spodoptera exigua]|uniref:Beta-glucosidase n=1 Tax=Spodoptera exigua TaxID=7107 RepID=A0A922M9D7_SPOEX|nr:hypothetical protein HF086_008466 [Spodoptera exigua]